MTNCPVCFREYGRVREGGGEGRGEGRRRGEGREMGGREEDTASSGRTSNGEI